MTPEDRQIVDDYMNWGRIGVGVDRKYDLNDAGLVVQEMQKRGEWQKFCATGFGIYFEGERPSHVFPENYIAWLFNSDNFFNAMSEWLKERGK